MTRRDFFRASAVGAATVPGALRAVSAPLPFTPPFIARGLVEGLRIRAAGIIMMSGSVIQRCHIRLPWTGRDRYHGRAYSALTPPLTPGRITPWLDWQSVTVVEETPPLWARLLRITPQHTAVSDTVFGDCGCR